MEDATAPAPRRADRPALSSLAMLWRFATRYPARIAGALTALIVSSAATLAIPSGFRLVIDKGFTGGGDISRWFEYLFLLVVILALASALRFYFVSWLGERVVADIRSATQANLLRQAPAFFEENRPSEIASRMTADTAIIDQVVGSTVSVALRNLVTGIGGLIYLFILAPKLAGLLILGIPVIVLTLVTLGRRVRKLSRASQDRLAEVGSVTTEVLGAMKIVQGFGQERREAARFDATVASGFATARQRILLRAVMTAIAFALVFGSITGVLWLGAIDVA
ncbi:MAG: ABC transporter, partial [Sphingobium sp.]